MPNDDNNRQLLLYTAPDGDVRVEVIYQDETVWLSQKSLAELFGVNRPAVTKHLKNIFDSGELDEKVVCSILEHTTPHGAIKGKTQTKTTQFYNLDAIIAVGYRVNSYQATQFRVWATKTLREFIVKGFVLDDERLKQGKQLFGRDYFERPRALSSSGVCQATRPYSLIGQYNKGIRARSESRPMLLRAHQYISDFDREVKRLKGETENKT